MRFILEVRLPTEPANALIKAGKFEETLQSILSDVKPEAAYLSEMDEARGGYSVVNLEDASQIPRRRRAVLLCGCDGEVSSGNAP